MLGPQIECKGTEDGNRVTCAVALLGVNATVASWFGVKTVELRVPDDGSGKLQKYFNALGFVAVPRTDGRQAHSQMATPCEDLAHRCCPNDWREYLVTAEDLNRWAPSLAMKKLEDVDIQSMYGGRPQSEAGRTRERIEKDQGEVHVKSETTFPRQRRPQSGVRRLTPLTSAQPPPQQNSCEKIRKACRAQDDHWAFPRDVLENQKSLRNELEPFRSLAPAEALQPLPSPQISCVGELGQSQSVPTLVTLARRSPQIAYASSLHGPRGGRNGKVAKNTVEPLASLKDGLLKKNA